MNEKVDRENLEARLRYRAHRGMLELDLLLVPFMEQKLHQLDTHQLHQLDLLLDSTDPDLHAWLMGASYPEEKSFNELIALIRARP